MNAFNPRGITIVMPELPGALFEWVHDEANAHGSAATLGGAKRQINRHLGSPDPSCHSCCGTGSNEHAGRDSMPCSTCWTDAEVGV